MAVRGRGPKPARRGVGGEREGLVHVFASPGFGVAGVCVGAGQEAFETLRAMLNGGQSPRLATSSGA